jgi:hypothetical protein
MPSYADTHPKTKGYMMTAQPGDFSAEDGQRIKDTWDKHLKPQF